MLPVILPARKAEFPDRFPDYLAGVLYRIGIPDHVIGRQTEAVGKTVYAKTKSRSLLGTLNDFIFSASVYLQSGDSLLEANLKLTEIPSKVIGFSFPGEVAKRALGCP